MSDSTRSLGKTDFRWLREKADAALRYAISPTKMLLNLFYAYKGQTIEHYLLFIGYNRVGISLLGHFLDVHPEMAVSHEIKVLKIYFSCGGGGVLKRGQVIRKILGKRLNLSLRVKDQWQGRYLRLRVIGDKDNYASVRSLYEQPSRLDFLHSTMSVPLRVLFTCRNPYDMVAAQHLRDLRKVGLMPKLKYLLDYEPADNEKHELAPLPECRHVLDWLLEASDKLTKVLSMFSEDEVFLVRHEDLIASPKDKLRDICGFLGVECTEDYLDSCAAVVYPSPHKTRFMVRWTAEEIERVAALIKKYPWFEGYTFDS